MYVQEGSLDVGSMSKTPPNRRGISFEVGAQLEARDSLKNWWVMASFIPSIPETDHYLQFLAKM